MKKSYIKKIYIILFIYINLILIYLLKKILNYKKIISFYTPKKYKKNNFLTPFWIYYYVNKISNQLKFLINDNCFIKNVLIFYLTKKYYDDKFKLNLGVLKDNNELKGHCWITYKDIDIFNEQKKFKQITVFE